jgi:carbon monoxide dehydrogenase subunit G
MELDNEFDVDVPVEEAWRILTDLELVAPCMPGAQLTEVEGNEFRGLVKVKCGPISAQYEGTARFTERDDVAHRAVLDAKGRETRGQGNANAQIVAELASQGTGTHVSVHTDLTIAGKLAQFGRGALADVSTNLMGEFVSCLEEDLLSDTSSPGSAAAPDPAVATPPAAAARPDAAPGSDEATPSADESVDGGGVRKIDGPEVEHLDLLSVAGGTMLKYALPVVIVLAALVVLIVILV